MELFFKWIKQNLKIKSFFGHTINTAATQIFVALCVYLPMAYQKRNRPDIPDIYASRQLEWLLA